jgi:hypothetical protein
MAAGIIADSSALAAPGFSSEELARAEQVRTSLEDELREAQVRRGALESSCIRIGRYLQEVSEKNYYRAYGYDRFGDYRKALETKFDRKRAQMYGYKGVVEQLTGIVEDADLEKIGIEKAKVMARAVRNSGRVIDAYSIELAKDPKSRVEDVRADLEGKKMLAKGEKVPGSWFDMGFFASVDERKEINRFFEVAVRELGIKKEVPDWQQKRDCFMAAIREFLSTYGAEKVQ